MSPAQTPQAIQLPNDLAQRMEVAHSRGVYAPAFPVLDCTLNVPIYSHQERGYPFILKESLPSELHAYITIKSQGSTVPVLDTGKNAYWRYDIKRWLGAIGIGISEVEPIIYKNDY